MSCFVICEVQDKIFDEQIFLCNVLDQFCAFRNTYIVCVIT